MTYPPNGTQYTACRHTHMYTDVHYTVHIYYVVGMLLTIALVFPVIKILYDLLRMSFFAQQKGYPKTEIDIFVIVLHHDGSGESHDGVLYVCVYPYMCCTH